MTYLIIAAIMTIVGVSPERTQAPLGWLYVLCGALVFAALAWVTPRVQGEKPTPG
ncbi:hypothetical protein I551_4311 [Mycobacterium ulcerans str. Harvey]|nr:hypothetical protein I551_4311 [Mycobacterium ulcerans str. Harvey]